MRRTLSPIALVGSICIGLMFTIGGGANVGRWETWVGGLIVLVSAVALGAVLVRQSRRKVHSVDDDVSKRR